VFLATPTVQADPKLQPRPQVLLEQLAKIGDLLEEAGRARSFEITDNSLEPCWQQLSQIADELLGELAVLVDARTRNPQLVSQHGGKRSVKA